MHCNTLHPQCNTLGFLVKSESYYLCSATQQGRNSLSLTVATHCNYNALLHLQCSVAQCTTVQYTAPQCNTPGSSEEERELVLVPHSTRGNTLQHSATLCNTPGSSEEEQELVLVPHSTRGNTLQHSATLCNSLQHTWIFGRRARASARATLPSSQGQKFVVAHHGN